jgi:hypothetical protein
MKRKNLFVIIAISVALLLFLLLYFLLTTKREINEKHIQLKFVVHNCGSVVSKKSELRPEFIKPLLEQFTLKQANSSLERNYFASLSCRNGRAFCIPAQGINAIRYNSDDSTASFYSSSARAKDEESFFSSWDGGDIFNQLERALRTGKKDNNNPSIFDLKIQDTEQFIDSFIIDRKSTGGEPFIFSSTKELRTFVNEQIKKFPNGSKTIHIFTYCGDEYLQNPDDRDNDGVLNKEDKCPDEIGVKSNNGCPIPSDQDGDGVIDSKDKCLKKFGEKKCDGCPCPPPPPGCKDKDNDGICDDKDKCPSEFGFIKYRGCPIPDTDGDGLNDEVDKCPKQFGPLSNDGCPLKINILHNNSNGTFTVEGIGNINDYIVMMTIRQPNGKIVEHKFSGYVCPYKDESREIIRTLGAPVDLDITISVRDKNNKEIKSFKYSNLSMICFSDESCGFVDLDKY